MMDDHGKDTEEDGRADADGAEWHVPAISGAVSHSDSLGHEDGMHLVSSCLIDLPRLCQAKQSKQIIRVQCTSKETSPTKSMQDYHLQISNVACPKEIGDGFRPPSISSSSFQQWPEDGFCRARKSRISSTSTLYKRAIVFWCQSVKH